MSQPIWEDTDIYLKYTQNQQAAEGGIRHGGSFPSSATHRWRHLCLGVLIVAVDIYRSRKEGMWGETKTGQLSS